MVDSHHPEPFSTGTAASQRIAGCSPKSLDGGDDPEPTSRTVRLNSTKKRNKVNALYRSSSIDEWNADIIRSKVNRWLGFHTPLFELQYSSNLRSSSFAIQYSTEVRWHVSLADWSCEIASS